MKRLLSAALLSVSVLFAAPALAVDVTSSDSAPIKPKEHEMGEGFDVGVLAHFVTVDPIIGVFYDRSTSVSGYTFGGFYTRRAPHGLRITVDATYNAVNPKDGPWLGSGKDKSASEWTEFRTGGKRGFVLYSADVLVGHEFGQNGTFGFYFGGGIGLAVAGGTITSYDTTGANFDQSAKPAGEDKKKVPPVTPTILMKFGPTVNVGGKSTLTFDAGLQNGLFVGTTVSVRM